MLSHRWLVILFTFNSLKYKTAWKYIKIKYFKPNVWLMQDDKTKQMFPHSPSHLSLSQFLSGPYVSPFCTRCACAENSSLAPNPNKTRKNVSLHAELATVISQKAWSCTNGSNFTQQVFDTHFASKQFYALLCSLLTNMWTSMIVMQRCSWMWGSQNEDQPGVDQVLKKNKKQVRYLKVS